VRISNSVKNLEEEYGVGIEDLNNDGLKDVLTACMFAQNRLYINHSVVTGNKTTGLMFTEEAAMRNITGYNEGNKDAKSPIYIGVGIADIDNNGSEDVYICNLSGKNKLYLNDGDDILRMYQMKITGVRDKMKEPIQWLLPMLTTMVFLICLLQTKNPQTDCISTMVRAFLQM